MHPILIAEDERPIADLIELTLTGAGYTCEQANDGETAADLIAERDYELAILDIMLPKVDGYELLGYLRSVGTPVIFVTAKTTLNDRVRGLRLGADDYLTKPFALEELWARIQVQLRHAGAAMPVHRLTYKNWAVDLDARVLTAAGRPVPLTAHEFDIAALLAARPAKVFTRQEIYEQVWQQDYFVEDKTINVHISNLRAKLRAAGADEGIETVWGIGFKLKA